MTRYSTLMDDWRRAISRWPKYQGYVYAAKRSAARVAHRLGRDALALRLDHEATRLAERFEAAFWCPEIETYAVALDGARALPGAHRPMRARSCLAALPVPIAPRALLRD